MKSNDWSGDQRRHFARVLFKAEATLAAGDRHLPCKVLDLSLKGALLDAGQNIRLPEVGTACALELRLDESETEIRMHGTIAHAEDGQLGLRCTSIDIDSLTHLRRLVELNVGDESILQRDLSALTAQ